MLDGDCGVIGVTTETNGGGPKSTNLPAKPTAWLSKSKIEMYPLRNGSPITQVEEPESAAVFSKKVRKQEDFDELHCKYEELFQ